MILYWTLVVVLCRPLPVGCAQHYVVTTQGLRSLAECRALGERYGAPFDCLRVEAL